MSRPVIALLTDFGARDHYAGTMKGVALGICPDATLVDISHEVPAHDVLAGALELAAAYRYFPAGTIFLAAEKIGRVAYGLEIEPGYVDVAIFRWQQQTKLEATLEGDGRSFEEIKQARAKPNDSTEPAPSERAIDQSRSRRPLPEKNRRSDSGAINRKSEIGRG